MAGGRFAASAPVVAALVAGLALVALAVPQPVSADAAGDLVDMAVIIAAFASGLPALILGWYFGSPPPTQPPQDSPPPVQTTKPPEQNNAYDPVGLTSRG